MGLRFCVHCLLWPVFPNRCVKLLYFPQHLMISHSAPEPFWDWDHICLCLCHDITMFMQVFVSLCFAGRSYSVFSQRMLNQCLESLVQKIQSGVVINFEKTGPDPPPLEGNRPLLFDKRKKKAEFNFRRPPWQLLLCMELISREPSLSPTHCFNHPSFSLLLLSSNCRMSLCRLVPLCFHFLHALFFLTASFSVSRLLNTLFVFCLFFIEIN